MADNRAIGVFDSGLGGLTVVKELMKRLPKEDIVYFGDTGRVPYGTRSRETIIRYAAEDEAFLLRHNVKLIVAACGTVSSVAAEDAAAHLPVPFFEVVSHSVRAALKATRSGRIGVIGTNATIGSGIHKRLILNAMPDARVTCASCSLFVSLVEEGWTGEDDEVVLGTVRRYLRPVIDAKADTLILGCTHYPVLSRAIGRVLGDGVAQINMGVAAAEAVAAYLEQSGAQCDAGHIPTHRFFVSDKPSSFGRTASLLLGDRIDESAVEQVVLG